MLKVSEKLLNDEFYVPLSSSLMLMQSILKSIFKESQRRLLLTVIAQINMLICLISDILDCNLIERGLFKKKV